MPFDGTGCKGRIETLNNMDRVIDLLSREDRWCKQQLCSYDGPRPYANSRTGFSSSPRPRGAGALPAFWVLGIGSSFMRDFSLNGHPAAVGPTHAQGVLRAFRVAAGVAALAACTLPAEYRPAVDMTGHTAAQYDGDLAACRAVARQMDVLTGVAIGTVVGPALGAAGGALSGGAASGAVTGVAGGAMAGAVGGALYGGTDAARIGSDPHEALIRDCMRQRGYVPLAAPPVGPDGTCGNG